MKIILNFLYNLQENNNRDWFTENKPRYEEAKKHFEEFVNILIAKIREFDKTIDVNSAKECVFRIYRDARFSNNKEPYKTNFGAYIAKGGRKSKYAGYYIHIQPKESFAGGGLYCPDKDVLKNVRTNIYEDSSSLKNIINTKNFKNTFGEIWGETLKTAPRSFPKDFVDIELIRYKSYIVTHPLKDDYFLSNNIFEIITKVFKEQYSFNSYLNSCIK